MAGADVEALWAATEEDASRRQAEGYVLRRASVACRVDLFLGVKWPERQKALILRAPLEVLPGAQALPETRGLQISIERLRDDTRETASLVILLREPSFADIFVTFSTILVNRTCEASTSARAAGELLSQLLQWQKFLDARKEGLEEEEQRGLYGELYMLRKLIEATGEKRMVQGWVGPSGAPQDLRFGQNVAIEVKTSLTSEPQAIRVNGERQLDDSRIGHLYLVCLSVERISGGGETLEALVAGLRDCLQDNPIDRERFEQALVDFGYLNAHEARYRQYGFTLRNERHFRVREGFPRITEAGLPEGVGQVSYRVALAGCEQYSVPFDEITSVLEALR